MDLITETDKLEKVVGDLSKADFVTVDTEFLRESTFWPQLCLIQIASPDIEAVIDPMAAGLDLAPFFGLMNDHSTLKVFHAARQDVEIIHHLGNIIPAPLFDTQVAAMVCGFGEAISYDQLVQKVTGNHLDKSSRFTDWSHRPLSESQLNYALADVTHLRDVYIYLRDTLEKTGRSAWVNEEMNVLTACRTYNSAPEDAWKRVKGRLRKPRELAVLQYVAAWREKEAQTRDLPRGRVLKDDTLIEIAIQQPRDRNALARLRSIPKGWERSISANELLEAIQAGLAVPKESLPKLEQAKPLPEGTASAVDILKLLLKIISEGNSVAAKVIATSSDIEKIALYGQEAKVPAMQGWRYDMFGKKALDMLNGQMAIRFDCGEIKICDLPILVT